VRETLTARRTALETLAKLLIDHEVVDGHELSRVVRQ
jgi:ATP-dependent Zn protease